MPSRSKVRSTFGWVPPSTSASPLPRPRRGLLLNKFIADVLEREAAKENAA